jgi:C-terminal processing protease CtpA/Prc
MPFVAISFVYSLYAAEPTRAGATAPQDYGTLLQEFDQAVSSSIYDSRQLKTPAYQAFRQSFGNRALNARSDKEFVDAFRASWKGKPFSHFDLRFSDKTASVATESLRETAAGERSATVSFPVDGVAVLEIKTFLGDTVGKQLVEGFHDILARNPGALIVDLRENKGGSLAGVILLQALFREPATIGYFLNDTWWKNNGQLPTEAQLAAMKPLTQLDPRAFISDLADDGVSLVRISPATTPYGGEVYVLTSGKTASIAEFVTAALKGTARGIVVGETTKGEMLSAQFVDLAEGLVLLIPTADYYSLPFGRIEARGVRPDIETPAETALDRALAIAGKH